MAQCPKCGAGVNDDFGLVNCGQCGAVLFVDMNGDAQASGDEVDSAGAEPPQQGFIEESPELPEIEPEPDQESEPPKGLFDGELDVQPELDSDIQSGSQLYALNTVEESSFAESEEPNQQESEPRVYDPELEQQLQPQVELPEPVEQQPGFADVEAFANSGESLGQDGLLTYNITIDGIDTAELRSLVRESLDDQRFIWDASALMASVVNGRVGIESVSAVKASILVSRLILLPVTVTWEQHAIFE